MRSSIDCKGIRHTGAYACVWVALCLVQPTASGDELLERRLPKCSFVNVPIGYAVHGLQRVGFKICFEVAHLPENNWLIDQNGFGIAGQQPLLRIHKANATVEDILQAIVKQHPQYTWTRVGETSCFNLFPYKSRLDSNKVGPVQRTGSLFDVLLNSRNCDAIRPGIWGGPPGPIVTLKIGRVSAREALNLIAIQHQGLVWSHGGHVSFSQFTTPTAKSIQMSFPEMRPSQATPELFLKVHIRETQTNGGMTIVAELEAS